jgi:hypothetical protein
MKNLRLIAGLFITTAFFVGCAVSSDPTDKSIRIDDPTVTHQGGVSTISNGEVTVTTSSLSLTQQSDLVDPEGGGGGICCYKCVSIDGHWVCEECRDCPAQN